MDITTKLIQDIRNLDNTITLFHDKYNADKTIFNNELRHNLQQFSEKLKSLEQIWCKDVTAELNDFTNLSISNTSSVNGLECSKSTLQQIKQEYPSFTEKEYFNLTNLHYFNGSAIIKNFNFGYTCLICRQESPNEQSLFDHIKTQRHLANISDHFKIASLNVFSKFWTNQRSDYRNKYITWPHSMTEIYCSACSLVLPFDTLHGNGHFLFDSHRSSRLYNDLLNDIAKWNRLKTNELTLQDKDVCKFSNYTSDNQDILKLGYLEKKLLEKNYPRRILNKLSLFHKKHLIQEIRKEKIEKGIKSQQDCNDTATNSKMEINLVNNESSRDTILQIYNQHYYCLTCNKFLHFCNVLDHSSSKRHTNTFTSLNLKINDIFCCLFCKRIFYEAPAFRAHADSQFHKNLNFIEKECPICKIKLFGSLADINMHEHFNIVPACNQVCKTKEENVVNSDLSIEINALEMEMNALHPMNSLAIYNTNIYFNCLLCRVHIPKREQVWTHLKGVKHRNEITKKDKLNMLNSFINLISLFLKEDIDYNIYSNRDFIFPCTDKTVYCKACHQVIPAQLNKMHLHFESPAHIDFCNLLTVNALGQKKCSAIPTGGHFLKNIINKAFKVIPQEIKSNPLWLFETKCKFWEIPTCAKVSSTKIDIFDCDPDLKSNTEHKSTPLTQSASNFQTKLDLKTSEINYPSGEETIMELGDVSEKTKIEPVCAEQTTSFGTNNDNNLLDNNIVNEENIHIKDNSSNQDLSHTPDNVGNTDITTSIQNMCSKSSLDKEPNLFKECILNSWELVEKENKYNKVFFRITYSNKYLCTICEHDIDVCNDATSIKSHLTSSIHKNNLSLVDVSHRYYCHPCNFIMQDEIWYEVHKLHSWHNERLIDYQKTANVDLEFEESECEDCGVISFGFKEMLPEHIHSTFKLKNPCDQEKVSCSDCNRSIPFSSNYVVIHLGEDTEDFGMQFSKALQELNQKRFVEFEYIGSKEVNQSGSLVIKLECLEEYVNVELPLLDKIHIGMDIVQLWKSGEVYEKICTKNL